NGPATGCHRERHRLIVTPLTKGRGPNRRPTMPILFDPADEFVTTILDRAKLEGAISLPDLEAIVESGIDAAGCIRPDDIGDTIEALARMGIDIENDLTQEQREEEFVCGIKEWVNQGNMAPSLTGEGWAMLGRVTERRKGGEPDPSPEEVSGARSWQNRPGFRRCSSTSGLEFPESDEANGRPEQLTTLSVRLDLAVLFRLRRRRGPGPELALPPPRLPGAGFPAGVRPHTYNLHKLEVTAPPAPTQGRDA